MERMAVMMPWPPSTNGIWRNVGKRTLLSKQARVYRNRASGERWCREPPIPGWRAGSRWRRCFTLRHATGGHQEVIDRLPD